MVNKIISSRRSSLFTLLIIWFTIQLLSFFHFGILTPVDSQFYIDCAVLLREGAWPIGRDLFYTSYISILAIIDFLGTDPTSIIFLQIIISGFSVYYIYTGVLKLSKNLLTAFLATLLYVLWFKFQQWNLIVYTESLYTSISVIAFFILLNSKGRYQHILALALVVFATFLRPTGIGFIIAISGYLFYEKLKFISRYGWYKITVLGIYSFAGLILVNISLVPFVDSFIESYKNAEIIYPGLSLGITPPTNLYTPGSDNQPLVRLLAFSTGNPIYFLKITMVKGLLFIGHVKPYYSPFHNLFIIGYLYPLYFFAVRGLRLVPNKSLRIFIVIYILFQTLTVSLTSENWDGRFILPILPWIFILAAFALSSMLQNYKNSLTKPLH